MADGSAESGPDRHAGRHCARGGPEGRADSDAQGDCDGYAWNGTHGWPLSGWPDYAAGLLGKLHRTMAHVPACFLEQAVMVRDAARARRMTRGLLFFFMMDGKRRYAA